MSSKICLRAPAKINVRLEVLGKRSDGYHEIKTLFQAIDLCDELTFERRPSGIDLRCSYPGVPRGDKNLCVIAAKRLQKFFKGRAPGVKITLKKKIPVAAGLGGASSDAATVLKGLSRLWELKLSRRQLEYEGAEIGSDVPFFVSGYGMAIGKGRGERLFRVKQPRPFWALIITPPIRVSTHMIYSSIGPVDFLTLNRGGAKMRGWHPKTFSDITSLIFNDLQKITVCHKPVVGRILDSLSHLGARAVAMSGSGPSVYALFSKKAVAMGAQKRFRRDYSKPARLFLTQSLASTGHPISE
jgi:4-diphosphocytidyl-2-C-methyl-D-erythritol kinase